MTWTRGRLAPEAAWAALGAQMIQYGFDVNTGDYDNRTALMLAVVGSHTAAVNTLLGAGADANVQVWRPACSMSVFSSAASSHPANLSNDKRLRQSCACM